MLFQLRPDSTCASQLLPHVLLKATLRPDAVEFGVLHGTACHAAQDRKQFDTVLRDSPVMRAISRSDSLSLKCSRRILPIMSMVITPRTPLLI